MTVPSRHCARCNLPLDGHPRCSLCGFLVGAAHQAQPAFVLCDGCVGIVRSRRKGGRLPVAGDDPDLLSTTEAGALLHRSPATVRRLVTDGRLPALRRNGRSPAGDRLLLRRADVVCLLEPADPEPPTAA